MKHQTNVRHLPEEKAVAAIILDYHGEYPIIETISNANTTMYHRGELVFNGCFLDDYMEQEDMLNVISKIVQDHPRNREWSGYDSECTHYLIYEVYACACDHIAIVQSLVGMLIDDLPHLSGDDSYFDYFPNTVEAIFDYADSLGLVDLFAPLCDAIFNDLDSPYNHDEGYDNAPEMFNWLKKRLGEIK